MPPIMKNQLLPGRGEARKSCFTCLQLGNIFSRFSVPVTLSPPFLPFRRGSLAPPLPSEPSPYLAHLALVRTPVPLLLQPSSYVSPSPISPLHLLSPPTSRLSLPSPFQPSPPTSRLSFASLSPPPSNYPTPAPFLRRHPGFCAFGLHTRIPFSASAFDSCCHRFLASRLRPHRH